MEDTRYHHHLPFYNIKAVSRLIGLLPVTLRAWERRYGLPQPRRGDQGYRLYSEYDLRTLRWLKNQIDTGLSISRAVEYLNELRISGRDPAEEFLAPATELPASTSLLNARLMEALCHFDEPAASETIRNAFTLFSVDQVLLEILQPTLIELGEAWHRGDLPIAVEHYATQFCLQHLMSMLARSAQPTRPGLIVAACAPGENHQVGLLSLVVMLRWRGWDVKYLGPDLKLDRLAEALIPLAPHILLFTATLTENAANLLVLPEVLANFPLPHPLVVLGGQAFKTMRLPETVGAIYLNASPSITVGAIEKLMLATQPES
jgi:DNA-binding transcriptional MerR regulator